MALSSKLFLQLWVRLVYHLASPLCCSVAGLLRLALAQTNQSWLACVLELNLVADATGQGSLTVAQP